MFLTLADTNELPTVQKETNEHHNWSCSEIHIHVMTPACLLYKCIHLVTDAIITSL